MRVYTRNADGLTERQAQVKELYEAGLTLLEIAGRLGISKGAVSTHVCNLGIARRQRDVEARAAAKRAADPSRQVDVGYAHRRRRDDAHISIPVGVKTRQKLKCERCKEYALCRVEVLAGGQCRCAPERDV